MKQLQKTAINHVNIESNLLKLNFREENVVKIVFIETEKRDSVPTDTLYVEYKIKNPSKKRTAIILLPGGPGSDHSIYLKQINTFFNYMDVVIFDPRGCGKSSVANPSCYAMDVYIDDIEDIRQQLEIDSVVILGTSYGSMAAQGYAIKYGKEVNLAGLILVAGAPSYNFIDTARMKLIEIGTTKQVNTFDQLLAGHITTDDQLRDYFKIMAPLYSLSTENGVSFHSAKKNVRYNAQAALAGFGPEGFLRTFDWRKELPNITCPTFIVVGDQDWINRPEQSEETSRLIPKSQLTIIQKSGHFIWIDQEKKYLTAVTNFLKSINHLN